MFAHSYIIGCRWAIRNRRGIRIGSSGGNRGGKCAGAHYETCKESTTRGGTDGEFKTQLWPHQVFWWVIILISSIYVGIFTLISNSDSTPQMWKGYIPDFFSTTTDRKKYKAIKPSFTKNSTSHRSQVKINNHIKIAHIEENIQSNEELQKEILRLIEIGPVRQYWKWVFFDRFSIEYSLLWDIMPREAITPLDISLSASNCQTRMEWLELMSTTPIGGPNVRRLIFMEEDYDIYSGG